MLLLCSSGVVMKSTDRLLNILSYVGSHERPVMPKMIADALRIPLSTVYRNLNILVAWEFVSLSERYGAYTLGAQSLKGQSTYLQHSIFNDEVDNALSYLADVTGESAGIIVADYCESICIKMAESKQALRCSFMPGRVNTLTRGASGKTLLAHKPVNIRDEIIEMAYPKSLEDREKLTNELDAIKARGYGTSVGEIDDGVLGISAPIKRNQKSIAVVSLMAPFFRSHDKEEKWVSEVLKAANEVSGLINLE